MKRLVLITTGLATGGAETMLLKVLERLDRRRFSPHVISLTTAGEIGAQIEALGVPLETLEMRSELPNPIAVMRLVKRLREIRPDIVHTWMYHADLLGGLAARAVGIRAIVWGIRNSSLDKIATKLTTRAVVALNARVSSWLPRRILTCSEVAQQVHADLGYPQEKMLVIPNGFDLSRFKPDEASRRAVRTELELPPETPLVGLIGRYDPQKNHIGFIAAAGELVRAVSGVHFLLVGNKVDEKNTALLSAAKSAGVADTVHMLGLRNDMPRLMASLDVLVSYSTYGEAFPNVLGEAMACGVPCVTTDLGDSAFIVGDTGCVVAVGDVSELVTALTSLLEMSLTDRQSLGLRARKRVQENFEIGDVVRRFESFYEQVANQ